MGDFYRSCLGVEVPLGEPLYIHGVREDQMHHQGVLQDRITALEGGLARAKLENSKLKTELFFYGGREAAENTIARCNERAERLYKRQQHMLNAVQILLPPHHNCRRTIERIAAGQDDLPDREFTGD